MYWNRLATTRLNYHETKERGLKNKIVVQKIETIDVSSTFLLGSLLKT
jgi:hypothetical protein